jgi:hypothetical protein
VSVRLVGQLHVVINVLISTQMSTIAVSVGTFVLNQKGTKIIPTLVLNVMEEFVVVCTQDTQCVVMGVPLSILTRTAACVVRCAQLMDIA